MLLPTIASAFLLQQDLMLSTQDSREQALLTYFPDPNIDTFSHKSGKLYVRWLWWYSGQRFQFPCIASHHARASNDHREGNTVIFPYQIRIFTFRFFVISLINHEHEIPRSSLTPNSSMTWVNDGRKIQLSFLTSPTNTANDMTNLDWIAWKLGTLSCSM